MMFTKEVMEQFTELDFAVYDCIVKHKKQLHKITIKELAARPMCQRQRFCASAENAGQRGTVNQDQV